MAKKTTLKSTIAAATDDQRYGSIARNWPNR